MLTLRSTCTRQLCHLRFSRTNANLLPTTSTIRVHAIFSKRATSSSTSLQPSSTNKYIYPTSLQIFNAGPLLTAYVGTLKLSGLYAFVYGCLVQAPNIWYNPDLWSGYSALAILVSALPLAILQYLTAPFVASISVLLPPVARRSTLSLNEFAKSASLDTVLEFTGLRLLPLPTRRSVRLGSLCKIDEMKKPWWKIANLKSVVEPSKQNMSFGLGRREIADMEKTRGLDLYVRPGERFTAQTRGPKIWSLLYQRISKTG